MDWKDIHDPKGEIEIRAEFSGVKRFYTPEVLQEMIEKNGVSGMIRTVNEHLWLMNEPNCLQLMKQDGRKVLVNYYRSR